VPPTRWCHRFISFTNKIKEMKKRISITQTGTFRLAASLYKFDYTPKIFFLHASINKGKIDYYGHFSA
jgi:hypothetical protein